MPLYSDEQVKRAMAVAVDGSRMTQFVGCEFVCLCVSLKCILHLTRSNPAEFRSCVYYFIFGAKINNDSQSRSCPPQPQPQPQQKEQPQQQQLPVAAAQLLAARRS